MFKILKKEINWGGRKLILETGRIARQANGSVLATYGGTSVYSLDAKNLDRLWVEGSGFAVSLKITDTSTNSAFTILGFQIEYTEGGRK